MKHREVGESTDFRIRFGGKPGEISARTFLQTLECVNRTLEELNREFGQGSELRINIKALSPGSFEVHLGIASVIVMDLLQKVDWGTASRILKTFVDILRLKELLKKELPKNITEQNEAVVVTARSGGSVIVNKTTMNIYDSNVIVREALEENFKVLKSDSSIESLSILDAKNETLVEIPRVDFDELFTDDVPTLIEDGFQELRKRTIVTIIKLVWDEKRKWEFNYQGQKISAIITDDEFLARIDRGESFSKGDSLEVELKIKQELDKQSGTYKDVLYCITRVHRHVPRSKQERLSL